MCIRDREKVWHRLLSISVEDIGFGDLDAAGKINTLDEMRKKFAYDDGDQPMFFIHAIRILCACTKDRSSDYLKNIIIKEAAMGKVPEILDVALDKHTRRGQETVSYTHLFGINEPVIFGLPILLNPYMFIPFVFGPLLITVLTYFSMKMGLVGYPVAAPPGFLPPGVGAFLTTYDWRSVVLDVYKRQPFTSVTAMQFPMSLHHRP